jgi:hypothetical protein
MGPTEGPVNQWQNIAAACKVWGSNSGLQELLRPPYHRGRQLLVLQAHDTSFYIEPFGILGLTAMDNSWAAMIKAFGILGLAAVNNTWAAMARGSQ